MLLLCHVRHINSVKIHPERIIRNDEKLVNDLNYNDVGFSVREKDFSKIEEKIASMCIIMKTSWLFQSTFQIKN